jgi:hypothetical protein
VRETLVATWRDPATITLDGYAASHRAVREMKTDASLPQRTTL